MRSLTAVLVAGIVAACAPVAAQEQAGPAPSAPHGEAHVDLLGNYVGKRIVFRIDGALVEDRRFTFPPPGATDRLPVASGAARTVRIRVEIEGCPAVWEGDVAVAPGKGSALIFDGCAITASGPA